MHAEHSALLSALREDEQAMEWSFVYGRDGLGILDGDGQIWMNDRFWTKMGLAQGEDKPWPVVHPEGQKFGAFLQGVTQRTSSNGPLLLRLRTETSAYFAVHVHFFPLSAHSSLSLVGCIHADEVPYAEALQVLCDTSRDWEYWVDAAGNVQYMTPVCLEITGYPREAFYRDPQLRINIVHEEDRGAFFAIASAINCDPLPRYEGTYRIYTKGGSIRTLAHACDAVLDASSHPIGRRIVCRDITESAALEHRVRKSESLLEQASEMARIGAFEVDLERGIHAWSPMTRALHEVDDAFVPTMDTALAFYAPGVHRERLRQAVERAIATGEGFDVEALLITAKGNERWVRAWGKTIVKAGKVVALLGTLQDIDAQKRNDERALEQERLRRTLIAADLGIWEWDLREDLQWINPKWATMLGRSLEEYNEVHKERWQSLIHPEDFPVWWAQVEAHHKGESDRFEVESRMLHADGHWVWIRSQGRVIDRDASGQPVRMYGTHEEITQRKGVQTALLHTLDTLGQTSRMARVGSYELDLLAQTLTWSAMTKEIHEVPHDFVPQLETAIEFYREGYYRERIQHLVQRAIEFGEPYDEVFLIVTATGKERYVRAILIPEHKEGTCIRLFGTFQDIDSQHRASLALQKANEVLEDSGRLARLGSWEIDIEEKRIEWSDITREIHEVAADAHHPEDFDALLESRLRYYKEGEHRNRMSGAVRASISSGVPFDVEAQIVTAKGRDVWVRVIGRPKFRGDTFVRIHGTMQDIDAQKKAQEERATLHALTLRQNDQLRQFAHIVSHNLRTHAGNLATVTEMLYEEHPELRHSEMGSLLEPLSVSLQETVGHLTEVARTTLQEVPSRAISLLDAARSAVSSVRGKALRVEMEFHLDIPPDLFVFGVPAYVDSILLNLLSNSIKYSDPTRPSWIRLTAKQDEDRIRLECEDNGVGIDLERYGGLIFGLYKTFHNHPDARGIGLFITRAQVEAMGGSIAVESSPGAGTTFMVWLPSAPAKASV